MFEGKRKKLSVLCDFAVKITNPFRVNIKSRFVGMLIDSALGSLAFIFQDIHKILSVTIFYQRFGKFL
jgi:hypothetical protein